MRTEVKQANVNLLCIINTAVKSLTIASLFLWFVQHD